MKSAVLIVVGFIKKVEDTEGNSEFLFATALLHYCSLPQDGHKAARLHTDGLTLCLLTTAASVFVRCVHTVCCESSVLFTARYSVLALFCEYASLSLLVGDRVLSSWHLCLVSLHGRLCVSVGQRIAR